MISPGLQSVKKHFDKLGAIVYACTSAELLTEEILNELPKAKIFGKFENRVDHESYVQPVPKQSVKMRKIESTHCLDDLMPSLRSGTAPGPSLLQPHPRTRFSCKRLNVESPQDPINSMSTPLFYGTRVYEAPPMSKFKCLSQTSPGEAAFLLVPTTGH